VLRRRLERSEADLETARRVIEVKENVRRSWRSCWPGAERERRQAAAAMIEEAVVGIEPLLGTAPASRGARHVARAAVSAL